MKKIKRFLKIIFISILIAGCYGPNFIKIAPIIKAIEKKQNEGAND